MSASIAFSPGYELGGSPDVDYEDGLLAEHLHDGGGVPELLRLDGTDPIDKEGAERALSGFSITGGSWTDRIGADMVDRMTSPIVSQRLAEIWEERWGNFEVWRGRTAVEHADVVLG